MRQYIVNAFTTELFEGNPAAVCVMDAWPRRELMQNIAMQNNLSETVFVVLEENSFRLRWFTPTEEVGLCGHATLAAAYVLLNHFMTRSDSVTFETDGGRIEVRRMGSMLEMSFPRLDLEETVVTIDMVNALGIAPKEAWIGLDLVCVLENKEEIVGCRPDQELMKKLPGRMVHITAPDDTYSCVSRSFGPKIGIKEDPVCGSAHCQIAPFWAGRQERRMVTCRQESARGGGMLCTIDGDRVRIAGSACLFAISEMMIGEEYM